jgi:hypothetical protein
LCCVIISFDTEVHVDRVLRMVMIRIMIDDGRKEMGE